MEMGALEMVQPLELRVNVVAVTMAYYPRLHRYLMHLNREHLYIYIYVDINYFLRINLINL